MVNDRQPWSVRGVAKEARVKAARAAHRRNMTIGEWVTRTVIEAANRDLGEESAQGGESAGLPATRDRTGELAGALGALVNHLETTGGGNQALVQRMDRTEAALTGRMEQIAAAMYGVMQTVEKRAERDIVPDPQQEAMAAEQARIAAELEAMSTAEARRQEQMGAIADALTMLATKVEAGTQAPRPEPAAPEPSAPEPAAPELAAPEPAAPEPERTAAEPKPEQAGPGTGPAPAAAQSGETMGGGSQRQEPSLARETAADSFQYVGASTVKPTPRHHDPRAEEVAQQIREAAEAPPTMPADEDDEPRREGLFARILRRE